MIRIATRTIPNTDPHPDLQKPALPPGLYLVRSLVREWRVEGNVSGWRTLAGLGLEP